MKIYRIAQFVFQEGQELTFNYPKAPYRGTCTVLKVNPDGTLDVLDHSGRTMPKFNPYWGKDPMFKEMIQTASSKKWEKVAQVSEESRQKLQRLTEILSTMDIPSRRKNDPRWLMRNLAIQNGQHPNFQEAVSLLKELGSKLASPMQQDEVDRWHKVWNKT